MSLRLKRAYEPPAPEDGDRYLVERLWPRGVAKDVLALSGWLKDLAPSTELRKWYGHDVERWPEFVKRYQRELEAPEMQSTLVELAGRARDGNVTLVFATRDQEHSGAKVLRDVLESQAAEA